MQGFGQLSTLMILVVCGRVWTTSANETTQLAETLVSLLYNTGHHWASVSRQYDFYNNHDLTVTGHVIRPCVGHSPERFESVIHDLRVAWRTANYLEGCGGEGAVTTDIRNLVMTLHRLAQQCGVSVPPAEFDGSNCTNIGRNGDADLPRIVENYLRDVSEFVRSFVSNQAEN